MAWVKWRLPCLTHMKYIKESGAASLTSIWTSTVLMLPCWGKYSAENVTLSVDKITLLREAKAVVGQAKNLRTGTLLPRPQGWILKRRYSTSSAMKGRIEPGPGQESVWDYPRPPACVQSKEHVVVYLDGEVSTKNNYHWVSQLRLEAHRGLSQWVHSISRLWIVFCRYNQMQ